MNEPGTKFSVTVNSVGKMLQRHGMLWTQVELSAMRLGFFQGASLGTLCDDLHRSPNGVLPKLVQEGCIKMEVDGSYTCLNPYSDPYGEPEPYPQPKEPIMAINPNAPLIEKKTITLINGRDGATMSDDEIFRLIKAKEKEIEEWMTMKNRPGKLLDRIARLGDDIKVLVDYVDGRGQSVTA